MSTLHRTIPLVLAMCSAACTSGTGGSGDNAVRDSAGISIVERQVALWEASKGWSLGSSDITIGSAGADADDDLYRVVGAARLADGSVVIANAGTGELRRYGFDGKHLGTTGRPGDGPEEFRAMSWLGRGDRDSIFVWDRGKNRVTVYEIAQQAAAASICG